MAGTVKKLQFSEGTDVGAPTDLGIASSTTVVEAYANDAAFVTGEGAAIEGSVYLNTTTEKFRMFLGGAWRNAVPESNASDATKTFLIDTDGNTTAVSSTLDFNDTANAVHTVPAGTNTLLTRDSTDTGANALTNKDLSDSTTAIVDNSDTSKKVRFECSGITTATTRTMTVPDASFDIVGHDTAQVITNKDIDGGTAANTRRLTIPKNTTVNLAALTRKEGTLLYDTDLDVLKYDDGSALNSIAAANLSDSANDIQNISIATSVAADAMTISIKTKAGSDPTSDSPARVAFRNATSATGTYSVVSITAAQSIVIPSTATLGHASGVPEYIYVYVLNNAGTAEVAISGSLHDTGKVSSTTTISGSASSSGAIYSTTGRSNVPLRLIGRILSTQTTAGTWAANATEVSPGDSFALQQSPTEMRDSLATKLGYKRYFSDISGGANDIQYANGNRARLTNATGTISSVPRGYLVPKQLQDGAWVLSGRYAIIMTTGLTNMRFHITGVTFRNTTNFFQAITVSGSGGTRNAQRAYCEVNDDSISITFTVAEDVYYLDIHDAELNSKPNWVY